MVTQQPPWNWCDTAYLVVGLLVAATAWARFDTWVFTLAPFVVVTYLAGRTAGSQH